MAYRVTLEDLTLEELYDLRDTLIFTHRERAEAAKLAEGKTYQPAYDRSRDRMAKLVGAVRNATIVDQETGWELPK